MAQAPLKYPIGIQDFSKLRTNGYVYIDKTALIYEIANLDQCIFLSRPRRFGKSLLLTTIEEYFKGHKELFAGLKVDSLEKDWKSYPVMHFDFNATGNINLSNINDYLHDKLSAYAKQYGIEISPILKDAGARFGNLIEQISRQQGQGVVILIDEYDKGLLAYLSDDKELEKMQDFLRGFFSQLKAQDKYIRFAMLTGVARFQHLSIFSDLNNLTDISMDYRYATICGITQAEAHEYLRDGIDRMATASGCGYDEMVGVLKQKYDGYRFSKAEEKVFNPFSLLNALDKHELGSYWVMSGTSKIFIEYLSQSNISELLTDWYSEKELAGGYDNNDPVPCLYQAGFLTIFKEQSGFFLLSIPNDEIKEAVSHPIPFPINQQSKSLSTTHTIDKWAYTKI
ncbi:MAG: AAA family ATPase [Bacteroidales bacterium]|nr:AAA family ATPase [Bacteroidales bacterium]